MHTIVLATQKGGSGKSTLAIGLALAAIQAGHHVRLIETCQQGTLSNWQGRRADANTLVETLYRDAQRSPGCAARRSCGQRICAGQQSRRRNPRPLALDRAAAWPCRRDRGG